MIGSLDSSDISNHSKAKAKFRMGRQEDTPLSSENSRQLVPGTRFPNIDSSMLSNLYSTAL